MNQFWIRIFDQLLACSSSRPFDYFAMNLSSFLKITGCWVWLLMSPYFASSQTLFTDSDDLQNAVNAASPGDTLVVSNGIYLDFEGSWTAIGTEDQPITIKAETVGGVVLTGESHFVLKKAAHVIVEGFVFDAQDDRTLIKLEGCHHIRITRNVFELQTTESVKWVFIGGVWNDYTFQFPSHHNRIDHNIFRNKTTPGHYITVDGTSNEDDSDIRQSQYDRIDHNYFLNNGPRAANEQESIRIGWSEMSQSSGFTIVEHNLFEHCDGDPEIISVKSCDNTVRFNTFRGCYGTVSLRHGNRNRVEGNYFLGDGKPNGSFVNSSGSTSTLYTGGIRIYGTDHVIVNNYMEGLQGTRWDAPITLTQGDAIDGSSSSLSKHFRAERVTIAYNTLVNNAYGIEIGFDNNGKYTKPLEDIVIANNLIVGQENSLITYKDGNHPGTEVTWTNNVMFPAGTATLTSDGSSFSLSEIEVVNPQLLWQDSLWRASGQTPTFASGISGFTVTHDIDYQIRSLISQVGADHLSGDSVLNPPLRPEDVGPGSDDFPTAINAESFSNLRMYPNPVSRRLIIDQIPTDLNLIRLVTLDGTLLYEKRLSWMQDRVDVDLPDLANGVYILVLQNQNSSHSQLIRILQD